MNDSQIDKLVKIGEAVDRRGYLRGYTADQIVARQAIKAVEELGETANALTLARPANDWNVRLALDPMALKYRTGFAARRPWQAALNIVDNAGWMNLFGQADITLTPDTLVEFADVVVPMAVILCVDTQHGWRFANYEMRGEYNWLVDSLMAVAYTDVYAARPPTHEEMQQFGKDVSAIREQTYPEVNGVVEMIRLAGRYARQDFDTGLPDLVSRSPEITMHHMQRDAAKVIAVIQAICGQQILDIAVSKATADIQRGVR